MAVQLMAHTSPLIPGKPANQPASTFNLHCDQSNVYRWLIFLVRYSAGICADKSQRIGKSKRQMLWTSASSRYLIIFCMGEELSDNAISTVCVHLQDNSEVLTSY